LSGLRPIVIRSSTSSYVVPLIMSFGMLEIIYPEIRHAVERFLYLQRSSTPTDPLLDRRK
jgi:hypothetical protein